MPQMLPRVDKLIVFLVVLGLVVPACLKAFASVPAAYALEYSAPATIDTLNKAPQKSASLSAGQNQEPSTTPCIAYCSDWKAIRTTPNSIKPVKSAKAILPKLIRLTNPVSKRTIQKTSPQLINQRPHRYNSMLAKSGRLLI